ncbi:MAG: type IV secretion system protein [Synergistaceae bacterium]|jgi:type IV secretion system protein TrbL|nr:type IV secretion system protein [Synergistaceae bacterium]
MAFSKRRQDLLIASMAAVVFLALLTLLTGASPSFAVASTEDGAAAVNDFIDAFVTKGQSLVANIAGAAQTLFWVLAVIQFVWAGCRLALNGNYTLTGIAGTAIREVLFLGFFYWLLTQGTTLGSTIVSGLRTLGGGDTISPGELFSKGVEVVYALTKTAFELGVHSSVWAVVPYALALGAIVFSAAYAAVYLLEYYIAVPLGIILLGLGGSVWSKKFAENYVRVLISIGLKLAALQIAVAIAIPTLTGLQASINDYATVGTQGFFLHAFNLAGLAALIFVTVSKLPEFVSGLVAGTWFQSATGLDFTIPDSSSSSPVYAGIAGDGGGAHSAYREEAAAIQSSQYAGTESHWQDQGVFGYSYSGEGYSQREDLSAASSGASYSQTKTAEAGFGQDDALTESKFFRTSSAGAAAGSSGVKDASLSADMGKGNLRSAVMDSLASEGERSGERSGGSGRMAEPVQKQFPMIEMSPLQAEIFKGMRE